MTEDKIIVNATALDKGGALAILEQFIEAIPIFKYEYIVFVNSGFNLSISQKNIKIIYKRITSMGERFIWDTFGIKNWLKENKVNPVATISLQNTNFRTKASIPNFIYFHNAIPFSDVKWNPFHRDERILWFYKHIYPFFVRLYINKNTEVFVQSNSIKECFTKHFNFPNGRIHVIVPKLRLQSYTEENIYDLALDKNQLNLFYPATPYVFKNHSTILNAISRLSRNLQEKISLHLTCENVELKHILDFSDIHFRINFMGKIDYNKVVQMYKEADALLFPSFIETVGLPLIEAASFGLKIIVSDLPYSHEVLSNYSGVTFVECNNIKLWSEEIAKLFISKDQRCKPLVLALSNSWQDLFKIMESRIN